MQRFEILTGVAAPLLLDDVDTDQIMPTSFLTKRKPDLTRALFANWRREAEDNEQAFVLDQSKFKTSQILVVGKNFGCGSSREQAVWGLLAFGIRCIVARSFADLFRNNCLKNGVLPVVLPPSAMDQFASEVTEDSGSSVFTVDLVAQSLTGPRGQKFAFEIDRAERYALLEGLDDIGLTLRHASEIEAWERNTLRERPWQQQMLERALIRSE